MANIRKIAAVIILSAIALSPLSAAESGQSWARLYNRLTDIDQKYAILQNITPLDDRSLEAFYAGALDELVYGELSQYRSDKETYASWEILTRTLIRELGEIKGQTAAPTIWDVLATAEVPLLKSEAFIALGQMRATEYAGDIATMLRNLNFNTRNDKEAAEIEAFGAVVSLDKMKDEVGFEPLFYASIGWYSDRVTSLADEAVLTLTDNPIPILTEILLTAGDYDDKAAVLSVALRTDATVSEKSGIAVVALSEGLRYSESDYTINRKLANLRMDAINALTSFDISAEGAAVLLNQAVDEGDLDEKLIAVNALGQDGGDEATGYLADRLTFFNDRQIAGFGMQQEELTLVHQIIFALGETGNEKGLDPLTEVAYMDYTPAVIRAANESISKIKGN